MKNFDYYRPATSSEASKLLATVEGTRAKSGGTDLVPLLKDRNTDAKGLVNLLGVRGLHGIDLTNGRFWIGATTTLAEVVSDKRLSADAWGVVEAAVRTATPLVRNSATVGGNLAQRPQCWYFRNEHYDCIKKGGSTCFALEGENKYNAIFGNEFSAAVHPSNLAPALWAHGATVDIQGPNGARRTPIAEFFNAPDEADQRDAGRGARGCRPARTVGQPAAALPPRRR